MITHFQVAPLYKDHQLPGWTISFYYHKKQYQAIYHPDGRIEYLNSEPTRADLIQLTSMIHDLMIFHVYE
ncbi:YheE family protein [Peribacillus huizhouensis]|uniref:YheE family protein n=1 Tax=Peribacillus huizhouensis TaxID=1501239 RepID=A0ABR6CJY1_9BACI|nr:YheE family protein [Peribacillus huizhouensis]MBA9025293.1 hypothetical protein [Peribacillus huizhouensis]